MVVNQICLNDGNTLIVNITYADGRKGFIEKGNNGVWLFE